jgi:hypothetical protein
MEKTLEKMEKTGKIFRFYMWYSPRTNKIIWNCSKSSPDFL